MNVDGLPFNQTLPVLLSMLPTVHCCFRMNRTMAQHAISVATFIENELNTDFTIHLNTISSTTVSILSQFIFVRNGNAFD